VRGSPLSVVIFAVSYLSSKDSAKEVATKVEKHSVKALVIQGVFPTADRS
jgi:hypothetical protein